MEVLSSAKAILLQSLNDGFIIDNQCVVDKIKSDNDNIAFLPKSVWDGGQAMATTFDEEIIFTYYYQVEGDDNIYVKNDVRQFRDTIFIPNFMKYSDIVMATSLIHEYVHQCDHQIWRQNNMTKQQVVAKLMTMDGYIEIEKEAHTLESRFFEYWYEKAKYQKYTFNFYDIKSLCNIISNYREFKKNNIENELKYKFIGRFGQSKKP